MSIFKLLVNENEFFICQCFMISHHDTHNQIWKQRYGFYLNKIFESSLPLRPGRNYAVVLCNDFRVDLLALFWTTCNFVKGACDIKSFNISTASDVWFLRYRPSNMMLATDTVFINFLWAVYIKIHSATHPIWYPNYRYSIPPPLRSPMNYLSWYVTFHSDFVPFSSLSR